jgi:hypothetical protein
LPEEDYWQNPEWKERKKHVFILSAAGKPIYSRFYLIFQALLVYAVDNTSLHEYCNLVTMK